MVPLAISGPLTWIVSLACASVLYALVALVFRRRGCPRPACYLRWPLFLAFALCCVGCILWGVFVVAPYQVVRDLWVESRW